MTSWWSLD